MLTQLLGSAQARIPREGSIFDRIGRDCRNDEGKVFGTKLLIFDYQTAICFPGLPRDLILEMALSEAVVHRDLLTISTRREPGGAPSLRR